MEGAAAEEVGEGEAEAVEAGAAEGTPVAEDAPGEEGAVEASGKSEVSKDAYLFCKRVH